MIVLFTDFGVSGPYVGQMKAVIHQRAPGVEIIDLFADAPAYEPRAAAYLLSAYADEFPQDTVFLCVVDPGVGSDRRPGILKAGGKWFVGPENGLFSIVARRAVEIGPWLELTGAPQTVSATFHGRDLFAPAAADLAMGAFPDSKERPVEEVVRPDWPDDLSEVIYIDRFGNAMTGVRASQVDDNAIFGMNGIKMRRARTFTDVPQGAAFWYENSNGLVEIAVNRGRAEEILGVHVGMKIEISGV